MAKEKKPSYDEIRHKLDSDMLNAGSLSTELQRRGFINRMFIDIHKAYEAKQVNHAEYVRLINRLAAYKQGEFNDYIDILAGSAQMGMLEMAIQGEHSELSPEAARERSDYVTGLTGVEPIKPEGESDGG